MNKPQKRNTFCTYWYLTKLQNVIVEAYLPTGHSPVLKWGEKRFMQMATKSQNQVSVTAEMPIYSEL